MTRLYLITYKANPYFNAATFHNYVASLYANKWISDWRHYNDNAYIVASSFDVGRLYNSIAPGMNGIQYTLIIEVDPKNSQGWLPKDAWTWLQKYKN
ncbi:MAG: hypothetical protein Q7R79_00405 [bacterium]|nr:hypothetical protein [bacterium]